MSDPITAMAVGAAIGGGTSLARGKGFGSALQSAALGGALGGGGSYLGGLMNGAGATAAATEGGLLSSAAPVVGDAALISPFTPTGVSGIQIGNSSLNGIGSTLGASGTEFAAQNAPIYAGQQGMFDVARNQNQILGGIGRATYGDAATAGGATNGGLFGSVKDMFGGLSTSDKLGLGLKGIDIAMRPEERMPSPQVTPIRQGNPEMVSTPLYNVAPNVGRQAGNEIGLPNLISRMPLTEEEKYRLQQAAQQGYRG
jgi:hypothetical protein